MSGSVSEWECEWKEDEGVVARREPKRAVSVGAHREGGREPTAAVVVVATVREGGGGRKKGWQARASLGGRFILSRRNGINESRAGVA